ncbi:MAG: AAA family ATPase [Bacteroidota bacterium]
MTSKIHKAERRAVPGLIGIAGPSSSGKTFSALLLASGLCPKGKRIGFIDTELGRGEHYADNPTILANLPDGYDAYQLNEPYSPDRYFQALEEFRKAGNYGVVVIDSATHEWEGFGGCQEIADNNKLGGNPNWALAKKEHKRFMQKALTMPFHVIFCLRARNKTEVVKAGGKMVYNDLGMQPVQEQNFKYEMLIACMLDPITKFPMLDSEFHKVPDDLKGLFQPGRYITKQDGEALAKWISGGKDIDADLRVLQGEFRTASNNGLQALQAYWKDLTKDQHKKLESIKDECKDIANEADRQARESKDPNVPAEPRPIEKAAVTPTVKANEKVPEQKKDEPAKEVKKEDPKPATTPPVATPPKGMPSAKPAGSANGPKLAVVAPSAKPGVQAQQSNGPAKQAKAEVVEEPDVIPPIDEVTQNAHEIAAALTAEAEEPEEEQEELDLL